MTELNWERMQQYLHVGEQWCVEYVVRSRPLRGCGVGCFALARLLHSFNTCFGDDGMLWLQLAVDFLNTNTLSLYTSLGFVTSFPT